MFVVRSWDQYENKMRYYKKYPDINSEKYEGLIFMDNTGMKGKHRRSIFENDILMDIEGKVFRISYISKREIIIPSVGSRYYEGWILTEFQGNFVIPITITESCEFRVIGNLYQDREKMIK